VLQIKRYISLFLSVLILFTIIPQEASAQSDRDFRAVWVSTVFNLDYPSSGTVDAGKLKAEAVKILDNIKSMGLNAVILQVRPAADALYKSDIFPWSRFLTGEAGTAPSDNFDPLEFWVDEAHKRGLELHAWINPYRVTKKYASENPKTANDLPDGHPVKEHPNWAVSYSDGDLYFDPGIPAVRQLIIDGAIEICKNYDVDGIHLDDYFYPGTDFEDDATFKKYKGNYTSKDDWRRSNVDALVKGLHDAISKSYPDVSFGISPFGIWANSSTISQGSNTNGGESYTQHYADTRKWVKLEWLDYIAPQLYWHIGHKLADYETLVKWWADVVKETDVDLYIGHAAYRVGNDAEKAWDSYSQIISQLELNSSVENVRGSIFFRYSHLAASKSLYTAISDYYGKNPTSSNNSTAKGKYELSVTLPGSDLSTDQSSYYIGGTSDSSKPLYLNGKEIFSRSEDGFFGVLVDLEKGKNVFEFTQGNKTVKRVITRTKNVSTNASSPAVMESADILDPYPSGNINLRPGDTVTFSCSAPIGSIIKVTFNDKTFQLFPDEIKSPDSSKIYKTTYTYKYSIPADIKSDSLGAAVYSMRYLHQKTKVKSEGEIFISASDDILLAEVKSDLTSAYSKPSSSGGPAAILSKGMTDIVTEQSGNYMKLSADLWVHSSNLSFQKINSTDKLKIKRASYTVKENTHKISFDMPKSTLWADYDSDKRIITLSVSPALNTAEIDLPQNSLFKEITYSSDDSRTVYSMALKDDVSLGGFFTSSAKNGSELTITTKRAAKAGAFPLSAHTIIVDAGHGGSESGALGLLGKDMPEKEINLETALLLRDKLEGLGASVIMTRDDDRKFSLEDRLKLTYETKPDLFISIHANSMDANIDSSKISGFSVFYREETSADMAKSIFNYIDRNLGRPNKGCNQSNLYVTRGTWTPSIIFESAFMINPSDFQWLIDDDAQEDLAEKLALAIVDYFNN